MNEEQQICSEMLAWLHDRCNGDFEQAAMIIKATSWAIDFCLEADALLHDMDTATKH